MLAPSSDPKFQLSLAFRDLEDIPKEVILRHSSYIRHLDLSHNRLSINLRSLQAFSKLETLVLDNNQLTSHTKFPALPSLHTLWVNNNQIKNLAVFLDNLLEAPLYGLRYLSMLGNEACPNYFVGASLKQYKDYRRYVACRFRGLKTLDDAAITVEERQQGITLYSALNMSVALEDGTVLPHPPEKPSVNTTTSSASSSPSSSSSSTPRKEMQQPTKPQRRYSSSGSRRESVDTSSEERKKNKKTHEERKRRQEKKTQQQRHSIEGEEKQKAQTRQRRESIEDALPSVSELERHVDSRLNVVLPEVDELSPAT
ncbi:Leucine rich melanocyte differentiation associated [Balamuthia mandrillaris]